MNLTYSHWLIADDRLSLSTNTKYKDNLLAYFKHSILYNGGLLISDSQLFDNINFRLLLQNDDDVKELIKHKLLAVAKRDSTADLVEFKNSRKDLLDPNIHKSNSIKSIYNNNNDISFVQENCKIIEYKISDISEEYTKKTLELFRQKTSETDDIFLKELKDKLEEKHKKEKKLLRSYIHYDLVNNLPEEKRDKYREIVQKLGTEYYVRGLSSILNIPAVYAKNQIDLFVKNSKKDEILDAKTFEYTLNLSASRYVEGLKVLTADDIIELIESDEYKMYSTISSRFDGTLKNSEDIKNIVYEYQRAIDEKIVERYYELEDRNDTSKVDFRTILSTTGYTVSFSSIIANPVLYNDVSIAMGITSLATNIILDTLPDKKQPNYSRQIDELKYELKDKVFIESKVKIDSNCQKQVVYDKLI